LARDLAVVLLWSAFVRFVLTEPNILTDGGSGYSRLDRMFVPGFSGLSALIHTLLPAAPRFMWTMLRIPSVLSALAPPFMLLLARVLGFSRSVALLAGVALASLPLHAAMYSSDFELGALLSLQLLGLALVGAAVRFERAALGAAGAALLAYTCWGRPEAPVVSAVVLVIALPALVCWRAHPVLLAALAWFGINALLSFVSARTMGAGRFIHVALRLWPATPIIHFLTLQPIIPFWLWVPLPFGGVRLFRQAPHRFAVVSVGLMAGCVPLYISPGGYDLTGSYMEFFRYGTWALPWVLLLTAEGMEVIAWRVGAWFGGASGRAHLAKFAARAVLIALCMATPLVFRDYLARRYGPRMEEEAFLEALRLIPGECALVVPDDEADMERQSGGTIEIMRHYTFVAEEAAARRESCVRLTRIVGITYFLNSTANSGVFPSLPPLLPGEPDDDRAAPNCWYYFRGSYCYTGFDGNGSASCAALERRANLEQVWSRDIFYISHRLVTRPDLRDPPLYDPEQRLVLSKIVSLRVPGLTAVKR